MVASPALCVAALSFTPSISERFKWSGPNYEQVVEALEPKGEVPGSTTKRTQ